MRGVPQALALRHHWERWDRAVGWQNVQQCAHHMLEGVWTSLGSLVFSLEDLSTKCSNTAPACGGREKELRMHRSRVQQQSMLEFWVPGSVNQWPLKWSMLTLLWGSYNGDNWILFNFYFILPVLYPIINKAFYNTSIHAYFVNMYI